MLRHAARPLSAILAGSFVFCLLAGRVSAELPETLWTFRAPLGIPDCSPASADLDSDGGADIVIATTAGSTIAIDGAGRRMWMHGVQIPISTPPTVADVLGDSDPEVLTLNQAGQLFCLRGRTGQLLWKRALPGRVKWGTTAVVAADLDGDGAREIVAGDAEGDVVCLSGAGDARWKYKGPQGNTRCPAVGNVLGDKALEVLVAGSKVPLICLSAKGKQLWRLNRQGSGGSPVVADLDGDLHAEIVGSVGREVFAVSGQGAVRWKYSVAGDVDGGLCVADADRDGLPEVYVADLAGHVTAISGRGELLWNVAFGSRIRRCPSVADIDGDGQAEILVAGYDGKLSVFDSHGERKSAVELPAVTNATPLVAMLGKAALPAVVVPTIAGTVTAYRWPGARVGGPVLWPEYRFDAARRAATSGTRPTSRARIKTVDFGRLHVGSNQLRAVIANPDGEAITVTLGVVREGREPLRKTLSSTTKTIDAQLAYELPARAPTTIELMCVVSTHGKTLAARRRTVTVVPFQKDLADLEALAHELSDLAATLPAAPALAGIAARIEARLPSFRRRVLVTGTLSDVEHRRLRDEIAAEFDRADRWLPVARRAAKALREGTHPLVLAAANPWAPFGGLDEIAEGRLRPGRLHVEAFGGETASAALNVFNLAGKPLCTRVQVDPFRREGGGQHMSRGIVILHETVAVPTQTQDLAPDALPKLNQGQVLVLPGWHARQLWLEINTADLPPGTWRTQVRLRTLEPASRSFVAPLEVKVSTVHLPAKQPIRLCHWAYVHSSRLKDQPEAALRDMVEHGTNVFVTSFVPHARYNAGGEIVGKIDYAAHDAFVRRYAPHGIILFQHTGILTGPSAPKSSAYARAHIALLRAWVRHLRSVGVGYDGFALYPVDEPGLRDGLVDRYLLFAKLARKADPRIQMYTDPVSRITIDELRSMLPYVDIWCPNRSGFLLDRGQDKLDLIKSSGKTIWTYECMGNAKHQSPLGYYRAQAWLVWHHGLSGIGFWSYCTSSADPWYAPGNTQDYLLIYQGDGVVSSKRWEAVRDGVEDYSMLWALRQAVRRAPPDVQRKATRLLGAEASGIARFCGIDKDGTVPGKDGLVGVRRVADRRWQQIQAVRRKLMDLLERVTAR